VIAKRRSAGPSDPEKALITAACQRFIDEVLKPRFLPTIRPTQFNYPVDILGKWQGSRYRFVQRYGSGFPENSGEAFEAPVHPPRLGEPRPLRYPVASAHRNLVLPLSRPVARRSHQDHRDRRTTASPIATLHP
jgi:hypothetical protein